MAGPTAGIAGRGTRGGGAPGRGRGPANFCLPQRSPSAPLPELAGP